MSRTAQSVVNDAAFLSSGTMATLTGKNRYDELEVIQYKFVLWLANVDASYETWVDAWNAYQAQKASA